MKRWMCGLALIILLSPFCLAADKKAKALNAKKMYGSWTYVSGTKAGKASVKEALAGKVTIKKDAFMIPGPNGVTLNMSYKFDGKASPATIDLEITNGDFKGSKAKGLVKIEKGQLHVIYTAEGDRPKKFESTKDNNAFYFVLKKAKK